jgi:uncharacterized protein YbcI
MSDDLTRSEVGAAISRDLLRIHEETYGKGAAQASTLISEDLVVVVLDEIELMHNEQFLVGAGEAQAVIDVRGRYQQAIEATFRAAVERQTGRRVISFASVTKLDPNYIVEIFRLAPQAAPPGADGTAEAISRGDA